MAYDHLTAKLCEENDQLEERVRELEEALDWVCGTAVRRDNFTMITNEAHERARRALEGGK